MLLRSQGTSWKNATRFNVSNIDAKTMSDFNTRATQILDELNSQSLSWVLKEPRYPLKLIFASLLMVVLRTYQNVFDISAVDEVLERSGHCGSDS